LVHSAVLARLADAGLLSPPLPRARRISLPLLRARRASVPRVPQAWRPQAQQLPASASLALASPLLACPP
jgi:hypothetical protein